ncbi:MerR family transcriptional regulator [Catellatospora sp. TT07R-123]|uniref:MerR family transcriptional regulator n=1 Tax=Catellatospora sp. TT07R-123 TaxID=2733863 RepID=UPI001B264159|nr:MerR family transcriptional regulator [Catellatospora sp. TT07R-123]GHJ49296.1 MerR family transcriptional regulator [Catellatospora sp. TT07R-123]
MRIGELSKRAQVPVRMLRYYEERGLIRPTRTANGYRAYAEGDVARASTITSLIRSGLTTKLIVSMLHDDARPQAPGEYGDDLVGLLTAERAKLDAKIACMTMSRDAIDTHLARLATAAA